MGNICPKFLVGQPSPGPTERSSLVANQHQNPIRHQQQQQTVPVPSRQRDPNQQGYTVSSVSNSRTRNSDDSALIFNRVGLDNLDKRLSDIATLFNSLLERYSNLKTGLIQLEHIAKELSVTSTTVDNVTQPAAVDEDPIGAAFVYFSRQIAKTAGTDNPLTLKLKEHGKDWTEAIFDSRSLQYNQISFLNLFNLLGKYAWELRSKTPPLRSTVSMTTQEEETFRRDLLVASLNSEANSFGANFARLRRVDEQLGEFGRMGAEAGQRLAAAGRRLC